MKLSFTCLAMVLMFGSPVLKAQVYDTNTVMVENFVGSGFYGHVDGQGELTMFNHPLSVVADSSSNLFVLDRGDPAPFEQSLSMD